MRRHAALAALLWFSWLRGLPVSHIAAPGPAARGAEGQRRAAEARAVAQGITWSTPAGATGVALFAVLLRAVTPGVKAGQTGEQGCWRQQDIVERP